MIIKRINNTKTIAAALTPVLHIKIILLFVFSHYFMAKTKMRAYLTLKIFQKYCFL